MKKTQKLIAAGFAACLLFTAMIAAAYFTDNTEADNTVTIGYNTIDISEDYVPPTQQEVGDNVYKKQIRAVNTGNTPCYIRVYADFSDSDVRSRSFFSNRSDIADDSGYFSSLRTVDDTDGRDTYAEMVTTEADGWTFIPDNDPRVGLAGYYYYTLPVAAGDSVPSLFTYVKTNNQNFDEITQYDIIVYAESTQTTDKNGDLYADCLSAWTAATDD